MLQRLRGRGLVAEEFPFTAASVGRLASGLFNAIRDRAVALPPDEDLLDELQHVRLRESSPGVFRMDHDAGRHDDHVVALALAVTVLLQDPASRRLLQAGGGRRRRRHRIRLSPGRRVGVGKRPRSCRLNPTSGRHRSATTVT